MQAQLEQMMEKLEHLPRCAIRYIACYASDGAP